MEDAPGTTPWGHSNTLGTLLAEFPNTPNGGKTFFLLFIIAKYKYRIVSYIEQLNYI